MDEIDCKRVVPQRAAAFKQRKNQRGEEGVGGTSVGKGKQVAPPGARATLENNLEAGGNGGGLSGNDLIEIRDIVRGIVGTVRPQRLMLPFHQAIRLRKVEFLFVFAVRVGGIARIPVADDQRLKVRWKLAA
jgi:hypothetical protein